MRDPLVSAPNVVRIFVKLVGKTILKKTFLTSTLEKWGSINKSTACHVYQISVRIIIGDN